MFLWFWIVFLILLTGYSLFKWLFRLSVSQRRNQFIRKFLIPWKLPNGCDDLDKRLINLFVEKHLDLNGTFLLWLISINAGELVAGEVISMLWDIFYSRMSNVSQPLHTFHENPGRGLDSYSLNEMATAKNAYGSHPFPIQARYFDHVNFPTNSYTNLLDPRPRRQLLLQSVPASPRLSVPIPRAFSSPFLEHSNTDHWKYFNPLDSYADSIV